MCRQFTEALMLIIDEVFMIKVEIKYVLLPLECWMGVI